MLFYTYFLYKNSTTSYRIVNEIIGLIHSIYYNAFTETNKFVFIVPGPVRHLHEQRIGSDYVLLKWLPPEEPNGLLLGYDIGYQPSELSPFLIIFY
jgi:hypothetical protein